MHARPPRTNEADRVLAFTRSRVPRDLAQRLRGTGRLHAKLSNACRFAPPCQKVAVRNTVNGRLGHLEPEVSPICRAALSELLSGGSRVSNGRAAA